MRVQAGPNSSPPRCGWLCGPATAIRTASGQPQGCASGPRNPGSGPGEMQRDHLCFRGEPSNASSVCPPSACPHGTPTVTEYFQSFHDPTDAETQPPGTLNPALCTANGAVHFPGTGGRTDRVRLALSFAGLPMTGPSAFYLATSSLSQNKERRGQTQQQCQQKTKGDLTADLQ